MSFKRIWRSYGGFHFLFFPGLKKPQPPLSPSLSYQGYLPRSRDHLLVLNIQLSPSPSMHFFIFWLRDHRHHHFTFHTWREDQPLSSPSSSHFFTWKTSSSPPATSLPKLLLRHLQQRSIVLVVVLTVEVAAGCAFLPCEYCHCCCFLSLLSDRNIIDLVFSACCVVDNLVVAMVVEFVCCSCYRCLLVLLLPSK